MKPNFLIIGAARAGTTALFTYIDQHPEVFLHPRKELLFFAYDGAPNFQGPGDAQLNTKWLTTWEDYCSCFSEAGNKKAIGEASPFYLCSEGAAQRIRYHLPHAKLIVVLREPVSRAFSSFQFLRLAGREPLADFRAALAAEEERRCANWEFLWQYRALGLYSNQIQTYLDLFHRGQIWLGIYDDLLINPAQFVKSIFRFLEVDHNFEVDISARLNVSGVAKSATLQNLLTNNVVLSIARSMFPRRYRQPMRGYLTSKNLDRPQIPPDVERELKEFYRPDIERLERLIKRDLSAWRTYTGSH